MSDAFESDPIARLRHSDCASPGISRRRRGRGFGYLDPDGQRIDDPATLARISALVIPPAWRDVWICLDPMGHLQATGFDAAGRKQYLYHERWRAHRDRLKFDSMLTFAAALPLLRRRVAGDLRLADPTATVTRDDLTQARLLALAIRLLDVGLFRIGSDEYTERNESYGLTTLRREHVTVDSDLALFSFPAKSGQHRRQSVRDPQAITLLTPLRQRRGEQLLAYRNGGHWHDLDADQVNAYLKRQAGGDFSAKDFRTWNATVLAAVALASSEHARQAPAAGRRVRSHNRQVTQAIRSVAASLGNTPAVCRASYVDPRVIDRFHAGATIAPAIGAHQPDLDRPRVRARIERAVLQLLQNGSR